MKQLVTQASRYAIVGGVCTLLDIAVLYILTQSLGIHYLVASVISFSMGAILNYFLCIAWVFEISRVKKKNHEFGYYLLITITVLLINTFLMWWLTTLMKFYFIASKLIAVFFTFIFNFLLRKYLLHTTWDI